VLHGDVGVFGLAAGVNGPDLLHMLCPHILVEQVVAVIGKGHGLLLVVPLSLVMPGLEFLVDIQRLVGHLD
jgi:hypothetical protein